MKRTVQIACLALIITLAGSWRNTASAQGGVDISYQNFYDELSPYGEWVDYPEHGYVWVPSEGPDFQPYRTNGHWVWSDEYEWMWVSDYSWGWAPFHYGRWLYDPIYGWMWVPGYEWSPAWVAWRDGGDYYGWAPLRPGFNIGINISLGSYNPPIDYWCFAPRRYISSPRIYDYCVDRGRNVTIINNTTIINNYGRRNNVFINGPRRADAERYTGRINSVRFRDASRPGGARFRNNEVSVYRPRVQRDNNREFTPRNFQRYDRNRQNNGNAINRDRNNTTGGRGNGNNVPERRERNNPFDRNNNNNNVDRQPGNNNGNRNTERPGISQRRNQPQQQPGNNNNNGNIERRRNVFDRGNRNDTRQPNENRQRSTERPARPQQNNPPVRNEQRRNVFDRGRSNSGQENRREMRSQPRQQSPQAERRQPSPQVERRQQSPQVERRQPNQSRPIENRRSGGENRQRNGNDNGRGWRR